MIVYQNLDSLVRDLGYSARTLYSISNRPWKYYRQASIPKANGETRKLYIPNDQLKAVQHRIAEVLLNCEPLSIHAKAYRICGSTKLNAAPHIGSKRILKLDIRHFFDSITYGQVKELVFSADRYAEPLRVLLTMLCVYPDGLPQGAPTSPAISNIVMRSFDNIVGDWCKERKIRYTRYCDDMTFSGNFETGEVIAFVRNELRKMGFFLNEKKVHAAQGSQRKQVTGIVVNHQMNVPVEYRKRLRQEVYYCRKYGVASHIEKAGINKDIENYLHSLLGKINYAISIRYSSELADYREWVKQQIKAVRNA